VEYKIIDNWKLKTKKTFRELKELKNLKVLELYLS
jgi:hypothetical protein